MCFFLGVLGRGEHNVLFGGVGVLTKNAGSMLKRRC